MFVGAAVAQRTVALHVGLACRAVGVKAEAIFAPQEIAKVEAVGSSGRLVEPLVAALCLRHGGRAREVWRGLRQRMCSELQLQVMHTGRPIAGGGAGLFGEAGRRGETVRR